MKLPEPLLFVALDGLAGKEQETLAVAEALSETVAGNFGFKANLDYLLQGMDGKIARVRRRVGFGRKFFADLKMWNGERTMADIARQLVDCEVDYLNVYALADDQIPGVVKVTEGSKTKVLGLTVLSHYTDDYCRKHFKRTLLETVKHLAEVTIDAGCHGIILPGTTLEVVRDLDTIKAVPGARPTWYKDTRHKQEIEPRVAVKQGADILVCGSPIMKDADPAAALRRVLAEMAA